MSEHLLEVATLLQNCCRGKERNMKHIIMILTLAFLIAVAHIAISAQERQWLSYEPATVELEGRVVIRSKYGPPNYGENPKTDQKGKYLFLVLTKPINVRGTEGDGHNAQSVEGAREIQLILTDGKPSHKNLIGKNVVVKGTLFHAHTGHHYTDLVLTVRSLEVKAKPVGGK